MDLRIVNTCNNNCLYCLEQSYRLESKFIDKNIVFEKIKNSNDKIINFYWWNSLLHPDFYEIIKFSSENWFSSIWLLTNTFWITEIKLNSLINLWLNNIWFYFNSFDLSKHNLIVNSWISLKELLSNIDIISKTNIFYKAIIHINKQNIDSIFNDVYILNKKFWVKNFEFINYFPFDRPYDDFEKLLSYDLDENRENIDKLFKIIKTNNLSVNFSKFSLDFFWKYTDFYDFNNWILSQIWEEDRIRLNSTNPFCFLENRCKSCFIKDNCKFYVRKI